MDFLEEIKKRGMLHNSTPELEKVTQSPIKGYIGFDPTAPSLHIGNLTTFMLLVHLYRAGHTPIVLIGGATSMIGDPSFKRKERKFLDQKTLLYYQESITRQIQKLLHFLSIQHVPILNNYRWYKDTTILSFLREAGKHISINYMMAKDAVKNRLIDGISYTEFAYQLLQAWDFYHLYTQHDIKLQMGGADQWGNITTGIELIRKKKGATAHALTTPLITKTDGTKLGKTEQGNIWLDPQMTSPYQFYQFWLNCSDQDAHILLKRITLHPLPQIESWTVEHKKAPAKRLLQKQLAQTITTMIHSQPTYQKVKNASEILFGHAPIQAIHALEKPLLLDMFSQIPKTTITTTTLNQTHSLTDLLTTATQHTIFSSKRIAREIIQAGGIRLNKVKTIDPNTLPPLTWLHSRYLLVQKGKKHYHLIERI